MLKYVAVFKEWINSDEAKNCHSYSRFSLNCVEKYWTKEKYEKFAYYYYTVSMWRQLINNEDCVKDMVNYNYYEAKQNYHSSTAVFIALSTIALIL